MTLTHDGKKTIGTAVIGIVAAWVAYATDGLGLEGALNATWIGAMAIFLRFGVSKGATAALLFCLLTPVAGCWTVRAYDPVTEREIKATIDEQAQDYEWTQGQFAQLGAAEVQVNSLNVRHETHIERLLQWLAAEQAKQAKDDAE